MSRSSYSCGFKMSSGDEDVRMEFAFVKENSSVSQQKKVRAFWKFLDAQNCLQPHQGIPECESPKMEGSVSSVEKMMKEKDIWRKGLRVFQQLGLDKTALAADDRSKLCFVHKTIQCEGLADTVTQPYEELNADMKAFEQRQKSRDSSETPHAADESNQRQCNANRVKTKK